MVMKTKFKSEASAKRYVDNLMRQFHFKLKKLTDATTDTDIDKYRSDVLDWASRNKEFLDWYRDGAEKAGRNDVVEMVDDIRKELDTRIGG